MNILGISAFYHESACCLLQDGRLVAAAAEERFSRIKHDARLPAAAFRYCLQAGGLAHPGELDALAYYEDPVKKTARQLWSGAHLQHPGAIDRLDPGFPEARIRDGLGWDGPILFFDHHASHAASAFDFSGFKEAALFTADGVGEWDTLTTGYAQGDALALHERAVFPHSPGLLYAAATAYLGFRVNSGEYKVMGLAAYGRPVYLTQVRRLFNSGPGADFQLDMRYFDFVRGERMFSEAFIELFGRAPRPPGAPIETFHADIAASFQITLEEVVLEKSRDLHTRTGSEKLCMAGGVALNAVANGRIRRESPFRQVFIQPAAGDAGGCLGAAALAHRQLTGSRPAAEALEHVYLGPEAATGEIAGLLERTGAQAEDFRGRTEALLARTADLLARNQLVGWFQGRMEFGPRALGNRSILANPQDPTAKDRLNQRIKRREDFRPFAPSVLAGHAEAHFESSTPLPFMLETCRVRSPLELPAVTHVDGSARPQTVTASANPRFAGLLQAFHERTGCPILLNTSFNVAGQPIVCTPVDALQTAAAAGLDALVLGDFLVLREGLPFSDSIPIESLVPAGVPAAGTLYTFV